MKKILFGLALVAGTFSFAQKTSSNTASSSPVRFGLKAGLNVSTLSGDGMKSKAGFYGGVFANIPVAQDFSVQPEVLYSGMGAKDDYDSNTKLNLDYIAIPVMFQYNALPNLYFEAGPQFSFLINSKLKDSNNSFDMKDYTKGFDFALGLGAGYYFTPNIGVNVRYVAGLTDIAKNRPSGADTSKNGAFQVGLAYKF
ncbi:MULTISPECIES: porin family protein [Chryseobacterium]|uniref:PorT family protein n=1 Tax=Chryseobacterium pennae TaxID=2258962 RepID=A0A3D9C4A2_9FLAO|nr:MULTISPECIES: porin family protein [Chryseobacterium]MCS4302583.1 opacity protein-like surface antigen [Chryseobacterium sp. BIGb0232]REC60569.1 PorT family protein [Chryseobacterium pennae]ROS17237.1 outer membrane protein with beta-barrel domain [Chryseobacterium nakagawai]